MKSKELLLLCLILFVSFVTRLYRIDSPIADWHSWRQSDTAAVSKIFVEEGFDLLHPRYYDISNVQSGMDNPQGYRFVEFPIYNFFQAGLFKLTGIFTIEVWGRLISIFASIFSTLFIFLLVRKYLDIRAALFAALAYGLIPYNIYYGRTILPDTSMVAATLAGIYFFDKWLQEKKHTKRYTFFILSIVFSALALLLKPYAFFFLLPIAVIAWNTFGMKIIRRWQLWIYALLSIIPLILWRNWISSYPEGIPANMWLLNGNGIRFRPAFFRWILYERITKLISGYAGVILLTVGFISAYKLKEKLFFYSFFISSVLYVIIFATGNVQHDYYQILIMPSIAIFIGIGVDALLQKIKPQILGYSITGILLVVSFLFGWNQVKDYFNINNRSIVITGEAVQRLTPKDAKIIAPYDGDTSLLYQMGRKGWPSFQRSTEELMSMGASYLVLVNPKPHEFEISKKYKVVASKKEYIIFDLNKKP